MLQFLVNLLNYNFDKLLLHLRLTLSYFGSESCLNGVYQYFDGGVQSKHLPLDILFQGEVTKFALYFLNLCQLVMILAIENIFLTAQVALELNPKGFHLLPLSVLIIKGLDG